MDDNLEYTEFQKLLREMRELRDEMRGELHELKEKLHQTYNRIPLFSEILANQIMASENADEKEVDYLVRWGGERKTMKLFRDKKGKLSLLPRNPENKHDRSVIYSSLPKCGTHFIQRVLYNLGFESVDFNPHHRFDGVVTDWRFCDRINNEQYYFPYFMAGQLLQPGQMLGGHILPEWMKNMCAPNEAFVGVRDLRFAVVSYFRQRHVHSADVHSRRAFTEEELYMFLVNGDKQDERMWDLMRIMTPLTSYCKIVRFEELSAAKNGIASSSIDAIASITGCSEKDVLEAAAKSNGQKTFTFSGEHSKIKDVWSKRIEDVFVSLKLDVANEELGYNRAFEF